MIEERYYFKTTVDMPYDLTVEKVREALAAEGVWDSHRDRRQGDPQGETGCGF